MTTFNEVKAQYLERLGQYVPVVARVHGGTHPEFHDVHKVFQTIEAKLAEAGTGRADLAQEFKQLREITDNYTVPGDVCESYEAVYVMLSELDKAYHV